MLSLRASAARKQAMVQVNGDELDLTEVAHELLLFCEKVVQHLRKARTGFEQSTGNLSATKAIEEYRRYHTPDNTEFEVSYAGPNGHGVRRDGKQQPLGCQPFFEGLKLSSHEVGRLLDYATAMESHVKGQDRARDRNGDNSGDEKGRKTIFDLLLELLSVFSLAVQTPEHFYAAVVIKPNGNFDHAAGENADTGRARARRFKKKPTTMPFIYPRSAINPNAAVPVCTHKKCKQGHAGATAAMPSYRGPGVRRKKSLCHHFFSL